jgi:hypothetical protein
MEDFLYMGPLHGRYIPAFQCPVTHSNTISRLHTALLHIDPALFREFQSVHALEEAARHPFALHLDLVKPVRFAIRPRIFFQDTLGQAYHALGGHCFTETMLDCYDHISSGTWLDLLDRSVPDSLARQMERIHRCDARHQVAALQAAPKLDITRVSLNFAMFRAALARGEKIGAGPVLRAWRGLLVFLSRWFQIESLYKFNAKFQPRWEPRFVVYRASGDLPRIGFAAMQAEGFVNLALPLPRFLRRRSHTARACAHAVAERDVRAA